MDRYIKIEIPRGFDNMNKKCQVFTPHEIVVELLDKVDYKKNLYGKKIIENACGDGNILKEIVHRYIKDCLSQEISIEEIKIGLESDIYGAEIDIHHYKNCLKNLDEIASKYGLNFVNWKILNVDVLKKDLGTKFDYVVGNPPYITYKEIDLQSRTYLRENYEVCKDGKFDYCYAFIEASLRMLNDTGKLAYLIPSSIFKNVFGQRLRNFILPYLERIYDYQTKKLFRVLTSSAIIICDKARRRDNIDYFKLDEKITNNEYIIDKSDLTGKWEFLKKKVSYGVIEKKFSDYFTASITIATLYNLAFVLKDYDDRVNNNYIIVGEHLIERDSIREAASPRSMNYNKKELIIFPYYYANGLLAKYNENEFENRFPNTTIYLQQFMSNLLKRDSEKNVRWFEYGRTQALAHLNQEKLLLSTVVTKRVKTFKLSKEIIPYSGIYITSKGELPLEFAKRILESEEFLNYVKRIGINANGTSLRITAKDINNYVFPYEE